MSQSLLNLRDIESWLAAPATTEGDAGFISKLFTAIYRSMASFAKIRSVTNQGGFDQCRNDFERFFLWGNGLSITDGDLDETLERSREVRFRVLSLLLGLGTAVLEGLSRAKVLSSQVLCDQYDSLQGLLTATETILQEMEPDEFIKEAPGSESDSSEFETPDIVAEISTYVDCLLDMAPVLENPAVDIDIDWPGKPPGRTKENFAVSSDEALIYCRRIRDRFESAAKYLVERLAEANVIRAATLRELQVQPVKSIDPIRDNITESLFSTDDDDNFDTDESDLELAPLESGGTLPLDTADDNAMTQPIAGDQVTGEADPRVNETAEPQGIAPQPPVTGSNEYDIDLDNIIYQLLEIVGDTHGQYYDLLRSFEYGGFPPEANYMFLGNYVDYGKQSIETFCLVLAYKIKYPENFFPLRGNHECASMNRLFGFYDECKRRYDSKLWRIFTGVFNCMPIAAIVEDKIFCMHGGLSADLNSMEQIRRLERPADVPDGGIMCDLLWSDPDENITGWGENDRGVSFTFGPDVVSRFLQKHDLDLIVRGHQVVEDGYEFFSDRQLVTLWGAPNWRDEYDNAGAMMSIDESLLCSFQVLKPAEKRLRYVPYSHFESECPSPT
ncbi:hypothetical protein DL768_001087 [Monosporascus sp. mg162]|nr:hypothetical protein DL768_001087 [Monosporascus sp. mg162]